VRTYKTKAKNAQEAHEAIRPTHAEKLSAGNNEEQKKLYALIWERTISSQMADAKLLKTRIVANVTSDSIPDFTTTGSQVLFPGWLVADPDAQGEDVELPAVKEDEKLDLVELTDLEKATEPPNRYSEAGLVKELEARGIGRPSTYAAIIRTIEERGYIEKLGRSLKPTDTGEVVSTFLEQNFMEYISDTFTAEMENELDEIASGERDYVKTLRDFYGPFQKEVKEKDKLDKATILEKADDAFKCPKCGSGMLVKLGRGGKFLSCDRYPDCDGALMLDGTEIKPDEPIGTDPDTGLQVFTKVGRFGPYVQLGEMPPKIKGKKQAKPKMASIPKEVDPSTVTLDMALHYLALPRILGTHPSDGVDVIANIGRFGPYVGHERNFRSIKKPLDPYTITLDQALELLAQEKKPRGFQKKKK
jgi:DNA topoisomerase-1